MSNTKIPKEERENQSRTDKKVTLPTVQAIQEMLDEKFPLAFPVRSLIRDEVRKWYKEEVLNKPSASIPKQWKVVDTILLGLAGIYGCWLIYQIQIGSLSWAIICALAIAAFIGWGIWSLWWKSPRKSF